MNRDYIDGEHDDVVFFKGQEVEKTIAYGMDTLFVVGTPPLEEILENAHHGLDTQVEHIYLGANHSFQPEDYDEWVPWDKLIVALTKEGFLVTIDFDLKYYEDFLEGCYDANHLVIPMVSIKLPYLSQIGYNACFKIDDKGFNETNHGVWVHSMHDITNPDNFTAWHEYKKDTPI